jgi:hypothetical protein
MPLYGYNGSPVLTHFLGRCFGAPRPFSTIFLVFRLLLGEEKANIA